MFQLLNAHAPIESSLGTPLSSPESSATAIVFNNVTFSYLTRPQHPALRSLALSILENILLEIDDRVHLRSGPSRNPVSRVERRDRNESHRDVDDRVFTACKAANIHDFITSLPEGYKIEVGPGGLRCQEARGSPSASPAPSSAARTFFCSTRRLARSTQPVNGLCRRPLTSRPRGVGRAPQVTWKTKSTPTLTMCLRSTGA